MRADTLNLFDSTVVAVSSVAPAYTLAATMAVLFATVGVGYAGPAVIWISFIPVLFIAIAYFHLNRKDPDCGASYAWLSKLISPYVGWFNGWVQVATSVLFCISAPLVAGVYTLQFAKERNWISATTAGDLGYQAIVAACWLALITFICIWGIRWTTNFQWVLLIIEYVAVIGFSIWGIIKVAVKHPAGSTGLPLRMAQPVHRSGASPRCRLVSCSVSSSIWGWDTASNLNEESKNRTKTPGHAGIIAMFLLLLVFAINIIAAQMLLPEKAWTTHASTILLYFAQQAAGSWAGYVMLIAVLSSTVATTQTTLLPAARITLSMARDKVFPNVFATIQGKLKTPAVGTLILAFIALFGILLASQVALDRHVAQQPDPEHRRAHRVLLRSHRCDVCLGLSEGGLPIDQILLHRDPASPGGRGRPPAGDGGRDQDRRVEWILRRHHRAPLGRSPRDPCPGHHQGRLLQGEAHCLRRDRRVIA